MVAVGVRVAVVVRVVVVVGVGDAVTVMVRVRVVVGVMVGVAVAVRVAVVVGVRVVVVVLNRAGLAEGSTSMYINPQTQRAIRRLNLAGFKTAGIATEYGLTTAAVRSVIAGDHQNPATPDNSTAGLVEVALREMKRAERELVPAERRAAVASVMANFCDVVADWQNWHEVASGEA